MCEEERNMSEQAIGTAKWVTIVEAHRYHRDVFDDRPSGHALVERADDARCPWRRGERAARRTQR